MLNLLPGVALPMPTLPPAATVSLVMLFVIKFKSLLSVVPSTPVAAKALPPCKKAFPLPLAQAEKLRVPAPSVVRHWLIAPPFAGSVRVTLAVPAAACNNTALPLVPLNFNPPKSGEAVVAKSWGNFVPNVVSNAKTSTSVSPTASLFAMVK